MTVVHVKGFQIFKDRHGKMRCYHPRARMPVDLVEPRLAPPRSSPNAPASTALQNRTTTARPGALGALIKGYRGSKDFLERLTRTTRAGYQRVFDYLKPIEDTPLDALHPALRGEVARQGGGQAQALVRELPQDRPFPAFRLGQGTRAREGEPSRGHSQHPPPQGPASSKIAAGPTRSATRCSMPLPRTCAGARPNDVYRPGARCAYASPHGLCRRPHQHQPFKDRGRRHLARHRPAARHSRGGTGAFGDYPLCQLARPTVDRLRLQLVMDEAAARWRRPAPSAGSDAVRPAAHGGGDSAQSGADLRTIADALGQKTEAMAQMYAQGSDLSKKMDEVAGRFGHEVGCRRTRAVKPGQKK